MNHNNQSSADDNKLISIQNVIEKYTEVHNSKISKLDADLITIDGAILSVEESMCNLKKFLDENENENVLRKCTKKIFGRK